MTPYSFYLPPGAPLQVLATPGHGPSNGNSSTNEECVVIAQAPGRHNTSDAATCHSSLGDQTRRAYPISLNHSNIHMILDPVLNFINKCLDGKAKSAGIEKALPKLFQEDQLKEAEIVARSLLVVNDRPKRKTSKAGPLGDDAITRCKKVIALVKRIRKNKMIAFAPYGFYQPHPQTANTTSSILKPTDQIQNKTIEKPQCKENLKKKPSVGDLINMFENPTCNSDFAVKPPHQGTNEKTVLDDINGLEEFLSTRNVYESLNGPTKHNQHDKTSHAPVDCDITCAAIARDLCLNQPQQAHQQNHSAAAFATAHGATGTSNISSSSGNSNSSSSNSNGICNSAPGATAAAAAPSTTDIHKLLIELITEIKSCPNLRPTYQALQIT